MLSAFVAAALSMTAGPCIPGEELACSLSGCAEAVRICNSKGAWSACTCLVSGDPPPTPQCTSGQVTTCTASACVYATQTCSTSGFWGACSCLCAMDTNACTVDSYSGGQCLHTPVNIDDGNACTADACNPVTGAITRQALTTPCCSAGSPLTSDCCAAGTPKASGTACTTPGGCACNASGQCVASQVHGEYCYDRRGNMSESRVVQTGELCGVCQ